MPVLRDIVANPTSLVIQGEKMRQQAVVAPVVDAVPSNAGIRLPVVSGEGIAARDAIDDFTMLSSVRYGGNPNRVWAERPRANFGIATPCGAFVSVFGYWQPRMFERFSTNTWTITGVTRDSAGVALGTCRVVALETGRVAVGEAPVCCETISDGSGNYSLMVPMNTGYWLLGYKVGAPDVGGTTVVTVTPT